MTFRDVQNTLTSESNSEETMYWIAMNGVPIEGLTSKDYILYKLFKINGSLDFSYDVNLSLSIQEGEIRQSM